MNDEEGWGGEELRDVDEEGRRRNEDGSTRKEGQMS